jgi:hypothetical protein
MFQSPAATALQEPCPPMNHNLPLCSEADERPWTPLKGQQRRSAQPRQELGLALGFTLAELTFAFPVGQWDPLFLPGPRRIRGSHV